MKLGYFPGCMLEGSARECDAATRAVFRALDVQLNDVPGWRCCGGTSLRSVNVETLLQRNRHNLRQAASVGPDIVLSCTICLRNLNEVNRMEGAPDAPLALTSVAEVLARQDMIEAIRRKAQDQDDLEGLRVASYYGCQLLREGTSEVPSNKPIETIVEALGGQAIDWPAATSCCGGAIAYAAPQALSCIERVLTAAQDADARAIVTICPLCHFNLDARQDELTAAKERFFRVPVFHLTELVGIVLGIPEAELWVRRHLTSVMPLIFELDRERERTQNKAGHLDAN